MDMFLFVQRKQKLELELLQTKPGQLELPKLRKVVREEEKVEEKKKEEVKKKVVKKVKKKESDYELPEIADYERPALEKYEKSDFDPNRRVSCFVDDVQTDSSSTNRIEKIRKHTNCIILY